MATLVLASAGTLGDLVPFLALGRALRRRGHCVRVAFHSSLHDEIRAAGLEPFSCGPPGGPADAASRARDFDDWTPQARDAHLDLDLYARDLARACDGAALLIASTLLPAAHLAGIPWIAVANMPFELQLETRPTSALMTLAASNAKFAHARATTHAKLTGFWLHGYPAWDRRPSISPELRAALSSRPAPIAYTFGSQPITHADHLELHARAARAIDRTLIAISGWTPLQPVRGAILTGPIAHRWLLPRVAAVIHHGGIGVTASALAAGCPMLIEPHTQEQTFNAWRAADLGCAAALHPHHLTARSIARILEERVLTRAMRRRSRAMSAVFSRDRGIARAVAIIEHVIANKRPPFAPADL